ncbi:MAG: histidinol-phosphatase [Clostridia bacterium]|nr:histidinol-phosphatase [Clostridia bacterium]
MRNFHTHTKRCGHARGNDEDYVIEAIETGISVLGFSDHSPMVFAPENHHSSFRVPLEKAEDYVRSVNSLKEKYKDDIKIYLGYEMEYYPKFFDQTLAFHEQFGYDYLILGQHFTYNEYEKKSIHTGSKNKDLDSFDVFIEQVLTGLQTGKYLYVAHPDLYYYVGRDEDAFLKKNEYYVKELKKLGYPVEFNLLGFYDKRNYPDKRFWEMVAKEGNDVVIGFDAHDPWVLSDMKTYHQALDYLHSLGIEPINDKIEIK